MPSLKEIVEGCDTRAGRAFDLTVQGLIFLSLITFCVETLPDLAPSWRRLLEAMEIATVSVFTAEYVLRILVADHKLRFIFSFWGLLDLAAILPFYLARGIDLRALRAFRLLRVVRGLKLLRYSNALDRMRQAFTHIRAELTIFFAATLILLFIASVGIYYFENEAQPKVFASVFHSMWWAVATLTTVGYGDIAPITPGGKIFTFLILMIGLGVVAVPTGLVASALTQMAAKEPKDGPEGKD